MLAPRTLVACASIVLATGCAPVASVGKRLDDGVGTHVDRLQVYSFVPMHPSASAHGYRGASRFDALLGKHLRDERFDAILTDVEAIVRERGLAVEVSVREDGDALRTAATLPEFGVLAANQDAEHDNAATHRLVLFPARMTIARPSGVTSGVIHWRLEQATDARPIARGAMRFTADARGFPARRMARQLVADLRRLQIH